MPSPSLRLHCRGLGGMELQPDLRTKFDGNPYSERHGRVPTARHLPIEVGGCGALPTALPVMLPSQLRRVRVVGVERLQRDLRGREDEETHAEHH